jgi:hypothetical protein
VQPSQHWEIDAVAKPDDIEKDRTAERKSIAANAGLRAFQERRGRASRPFKRIGNAATLSD